MKPLGEVNRHFWLLQRMARASGVDLDRAQSAGSLTQGDWATLVQRCRGCPDPDRCQHYLDQPDTVALPGCCVNQAQFADLREETVGE